MIDFVKTGSENGVRYAHAGARARGRMPGFGTHAHR